MSATELGQLSVDALVDGATLRGWRRTLHERAWSIGGLAGLASLIAVIWIGVSLTSWWWLLLLLFFGLLTGLLGTLAVSGMLEAIAIGTRARDHITELRRRYGLLPLAYYVAEERNTRGNEYSIVAAGTGLPHGRTYFVRLRLGTDGQVDVVAYTMALPVAWVEGAHPRDVVVTMEEQLSGADAAAFRALAADVRWGDSERLNTQVTDGFPSEMVVLDHVREREYRLNCNLMALDVLHPGDPGVGVRLLEKTMELAR